MGSSLYISNGGDALGPYEMSQLRSMWNAGQITAEYLYWNEDGNEWCSIVELNIGGVSSPPTSEARQTASPKDSLFHKIGGTTRRETPVQYWIWRLGSVGLLIGFLGGLSASSGSIGLVGAIAFSIGYSIPMFLLFAAVGGIVGLIARRKGKSGKTA